MADEDKERTFEDIWKKAFPEGKTTQPQGQPPKKTFEQFYKEQFGASVTPKQPESFEEYYTRVEKIKTPEELQDAFNSLVPRMHTAAARAFGSAGRFSPRENHDIYQKSILAYQATHELPHLYRILPEGNKLIMGIAKSKYEEMKKIEELKDKLHVTDTELGPEYTLEIDREGGPDGTLNFYSTGETGTETPRGTLWLNIVGDRSEHVGPAFYPEDITQIKVVPNSSKQS